MERGPEDEYSWISGPLAGHIQNNVEEGRILGRMFPWTSERPKYKVNYPELVFDAYPYSYFCFVF